MNLIAIDAGWGGAVAWKTEYGVRVCDCPADVIDMVKLAERLRDHYQGNWKCVIEANHAAPKFGARGNFGLGLNIGSWWGVLTSAGITYETINPRDWQKLITNERSKVKHGRLAIKEKAWRFAKRMYPDLSKKLGDSVPNPRSDKQGRADALCILYWMTRDQ